jgi:hypothetical protein
MPVRDLRQQIDELAAQIRKEPENIHQLYAVLLEKRSQLGLDAQASRR